MNLSLPARAWADLRARWRLALGFHMLMQLLGFAIFAPLLTWVGRRLVLASGEPVVSNFDLAAFALSPGGVVFVLAIAALTIALLLAELVGHSLIAGRAIAGRPLALAATIAFVLRSLPAQVRLATRVFLRLVLLALPFLACAGLIWLTTLRGHDINYYLAEHPPEWRRAMRPGALLGAGLAALFAWQLARWLYAVPLFVFGGVSPARALGESARLTRGRFATIVPPVLLWAAGLTVASLALARVASHVSDAALEWAGLDFARVLPLVATFMLVSLVAGFAFVGLHLVGHEFLITRLYAEYLDVTQWRLAGSLDTHETRARRLAHPVVLGLLASLPVALAATWIFASQLAPEPAVAITAHRGAAMVAPENSMAAFRATQEAGAN